MDDEIYLTVKRNLLRVVPDLDGERITPHDALADLGCNSVDRTDIVALSMEELDISVPVMAFRDIRTLASLAELLRRHR